MDLEKAYDTIDRHGMCQILSASGVGGKLMKAVHSFYAESRAGTGWEMMRVGGFR